MTYRKLLLLLLSPALLATCHGSIDDCVATDPNCSSWLTGPALYTLPAVVGAVPAVAESTPAAAAQVAAGPVSQSCAASAFCYTFYARNGGAGFTGNVGGVTGIDGICASEKPAGLPGIGTDYKGMVAVAAVRTANPVLNWVLYPNKQYRQQDGVTVILTTDASSVFAFGTLNNPFHASTPTTYRTGLTNTWATAQNCTGFTDGTVGAQSNEGDSAFTDQVSISGGPVGCNGPRGFICVQQ